jgi:hypothetical protein
VAAKRCPKCDLVNPVTATVCDCGRSFVDGSMTKTRRYLPGESPKDRALAQRIGWSMRIGGIVLMVIGGPLIFTLGLLTASIGWVDLEVRIFRRRR